MRPCPIGPFAWGGGLAIARYLPRPSRDAVARPARLRPRVGLGAVRDRRAAGGRVDRDDRLRTSTPSLRPRSSATRGRTGRQRSASSSRDVLDDDPPDVDVILAGDTWYEGRLAQRVLPWLRAARASGIDVLVGDPGRRYLPVEELVELAAYDVRTSTELEDLDHKTGRVFALREVETA